MLSRVPGSSRGAGGAAAAVSRRHRRTRLACRIGLLAGVVLLWAGHGSMLALASEGPPEPTVEQILDAVQARYDKIRDLRASFRQDAWVASIGREDRSTGEVSILRPGRMRWEYAAPDARVIALDGDTIRLYVPEDEQLQIAALTPGNFPPTALDFLLGDGRLHRTFAAEPIAESREGEIGVRLRPRDGAGFDHLDLWVAAETYQLRESVVVDLFGNRTSVRFSGIIENSGLDVGAFELRVPEGTETIDLRQ